jgi:hypothetical protein
VRSPMSVVFHHLARSEAIDACARDCGRELDGCSFGIIQCRMTLEGPHSDGFHKDLYLAKIELTLPGAQIYADNVHVGKAGNADIVSAIHDAFQSAKRQLLTLDLAF